MEAEAKAPKVRYYEFDVLRAVCILALPFVHVADEAGGTFGLTKAAEVFSSLVLSLSYGVVCFVALFGANLLFASQKSPRDYFLRGLKFLIIGVALNLCRYVIPYYFFGRFTSELDPLAFGPVITLSSDIYDYFGAFLILYALFVKFNLSRHAMLLTTLALYFLSLPLNGHSTGNEALDVFLGRFYTVNEMSYFPVMVWSFVPVLGIYAGKLYSGLKDESSRKKVLKAGLAIGLLISAIAISLQMAQGKDVIAMLCCEDYKMPIATFLMFISISLAFGTAICLLYYAFRESRLMNFLKEMSAVIMPCYFLHYVIIGWLEISAITLFGKDLVLNLPETLLASLFVFFLTVFLSRRYGSSLNRLLR